MHITLVYNVRSGSSRQVNEMREMFTRAGFIIDDTVILDRHIRSKLKKHIAAKAVIAVVGGDGTISAVAGIVAGTEATLMPLPGGTLNHFTKDLGIVQDLEKAIKKARHGKAHHVDVAMVNNTIFINNSSIGLYPSSLRDRNRFEDRLGKWPTAVIASIGALVRFRIYEVEIDGKSFKTPFVFVGNNKYDLQPGNIERKQLDKGILSVFAIHAKTRLDMVKVLLFAVVGRAERHERFDTFTAKTMTLHTKKHRRIHVSHDGELSLIKTPLKYKVVTTALNVHV